MNKNINFNYNLKVGDIVMAYGSAFWKVVKIEESYNQQGHQIYSLVHLVQVMSGSGKMPKYKGRATTCRANYCSKVTEDSVRKLREEDCLKWDNLLKIINPTLDVESDIEASGSTEIPEPEILNVFGPPKSLKEKL